MERYIPHPKDTRNVTLPDEVLALAEQLARNTHEVWAAQRLKDGWVWGPARDDAQKQHPCLVPYEELPEEEKDYDRHTALETLGLYKPGAGFTVGVPQEFTENDAARRAYICGAFLGGGSITLPADGKKTGYHLEIAFPAEEDGESAVAEEFAALAEADDLLLKCVKRGGETVAYMKSKEAISDFLSVLGAENALKKFGAFCEEREKNNNLNRAANCSSFNADKTATAAVKQVLAIEKIVAAGADTTLAAPLKKLIALRLARPELSLQELADELGVSKSCLSHRMRKLTEIAADIP